MDFDPLFLQKCLNSATLEPRYCNGIQIRTLIRPLQNLYFACFEPFRGGVALVQYFRSGIAANLILLDHGLKTKHVTLRFSSRKQKWFYRLLQDTWPMKQRRIMNDPQVLSHYNGLFCNVLDDLSIHSWKNIGRFDHLCRPAPLTPEKSLMSLRFTVCAIKHQATHLLV